MDDTRILHRDYRDLTIEDLDARRCLDAEEREYIACVRATFGSELALEVRRQLLASRPLRTGATT
jgi:hypothetical protein